MFRFHILGKGRVVYSGSFSTIFIYRLMWCYNQTFNSLPKSKPFNVPLSYPGQRQSHLFRQCYDRFYCLPAKGTACWDSHQRKIGTYRMWKCTFSPKNTDRVVILNFQDPNWLNTKGPTGWDSHQRKISIGCTWTFGHFTYEDILLITNKYRMYVEIFLVNIFYL